MKAWTDITHYAGFDWAKDHHGVVIVDAQGGIVADFEFSHSLEGWKRLVEQTSAWPNLAVAIETSQGAAVDQLLQRGYTLYPVHPVAAQSYRERKAPSGTKTDHLDAWGLADALRVDGHGWRVLQPTDPMTEQLRLLCRDEVALIEQRTALVNQLQQALAEYYPAALEAFEDWTKDFTWEFVVAFPTPQALVKAGQRRWEKFLHTHKLWRPETTQKRLQIFARADQFKASDPIVAAKSQLAVSLCALLRTLGLQLELYRQQIEALFKKIPIIISLAASREPSRSWRRGSCPPSASIPIATATIKSSSVSRGPRRSLTSPANSTKCASVGPATSSCATPSTSGPIAFGKPARGAVPITNRNATPA